MIDKVKNLITKIGIIIFWCLVLNAFYKLFVLFLGV
jgi:hypothetical protein